MALSITVDVSKAAAEAPLELERRAAALQGPGLHKVIGRSVANLFVQHFYRLDAARANKMGGERTHFYGDAAKATSSTGDAEGATVTVSQLGIRQRLEGGTIKPTQGKYLTIPARAEAYGRRARDYERVYGKLDFVPTSRGGALVRRFNVHSLEHSTQERMVIYWLVPFVVQKKDPSVLPSDDAVSAVVVSIVDSYWERAAARRAMAEAKKGNP